MDMKAHLTAAWDLWLKNITPLVLMTVVMFLVGMVTLGILAPVLLAGYVDSILLLTRDGRQPRVGDLFGQMRLFFPLLVFGLAMVVISVIAFSFFFLPGVALGLAVTYFCLYMIPLMVDRNLPLMEAIKGSVSMVAGKGVGDQIVAAAIFIGISAVGGSVPFLVLFAQPLATVFLMRVYDERIQTFDPV